MNFEDNNTKRMMSGDHVKGLTNRFLAKMKENSQSVQESHQISTFYYFYVFLKYF